MTIGKRISLLYALPVAVAVAVGGASLIDLRLMDGAIAKFAGGSLPGTYSVGRLSGIAKGIRGGIRGHIEGRFDLLPRTMAHIGPVSMAGKSEDALRQFRVETVPAYQQVQKAIEAVSASKRQDGNSNAAAAVSSAQNAQTIVWTLLAISRLSCGLPGWCAFNHLRQTLHPIMQA